MHRRRRHDGVVDDVVADDDEYRFFKGYFRNLREKICMYGVFHGHMWIFENFQNYAPATAACCCRRCGRR